MKVFQNFKHHRFDDYYAQRMAEKEFENCCERVERLHSDLFIFTSEEKPT